MRNKMIQARSLLTLALVSSTIAGTSGCQSFTTASNAKGKKKDSSWTWFKKKEYQTPQSVNVTWMHDVLSLPGKPATRGFGGRFYFYNEKTQAIPVDGELVVFGFDDSDARRKTDDLGQADKKFRFTAEQLTSHFSESQLGASYSVWIPWDAAPGKQKKIMLIPTFVAKDGTAIRGAAASLSLPGKSELEEPPYEVVQSSASMSANDYAKQMQSPAFQEAPSSLRTTTIQLPPRSVRRQSETPVMQAPMAANAGMLSAPNAMPMQVQSLQQVPPEMAMMDANMGQANMAPPNQMQPRSVFTPPSSMPVSANSMPSRNANGWMMPEFAQPNWTGLQAHSGPNSPQAPVSTAAQPSSYPIR